MSPHLGQTNIYKVENGVRKKAIEKTFCNKSTLNSVFTYTVWCPDVKMNEQCDNILSNET